jgi:Kef-type K+ transport system membrane component KefB/nucleotide-binding universal stress UspA family protein
LVRAGAARIGSFGAALVFLLGTSAFGAEATINGPSEFLFLVQVAIFIFVGRGLGELMQRVGQPAVMGPLVAGLLLGPSVLGSLWPAAQHAIFPINQEQRAMIEGVAQFGVLMLLLLTGMETDLKLVRRVGRAAVPVSLTGICIPFACGFALGQFLPAGLMPHPEQRLIASLFLGIALSISSVKIVAMVVREMNFIRRNVGQVIVVSAIIDDTIGWIVVAIIFSLASHGSLDAASLAITIFETMVFLAISFSIGRRLVFSLIRWANDNLVSEVPVITVILLLMAGMALTTHLIGLHTVLGAFVAGILVGGSPILTRHIDEQLRGLIASVFMPVFFGLAGLNADLTVLKDIDLLLLTGTLILIASIGKFAGAFLGGWMGGMTYWESLALACAMNARGSTEVIVVTIGLSMGVLSQNLFTMIVAMAIITTMAMPPMLRWVLTRLPLRADEKARLDREAYEEKGFVANLERLLLAVDESANGQFASRLAGFVAGARGIPTTVLHIGQPANGQAEHRSGAESPETAFKAGAETIAAVERQTEDQQPTKAAVTSRATAKQADDAVAEEARKGYNLLFIGVAKITASNAGFHPDVERAAKGFEGPLAVVAARGPHLQNPATGRLKILVPFTGTAVSRRAAEVAVALARTTNVPLTALYVSHSGVRDGSRVGATHRQGEALLKDVVALAERYNTEIRTAVSADDLAEEAILKEAGAGRYDLIVMGVNRRPGPTLLAGDVATSILEKSKASVLLLST